MRGLRREKGLKTMGTHRIGHRCLDTTLLVADYRPGYDR
jgi:hypothetical protein